MKRTPPLAHTSHIFRVMFPYFIYEEGSPPSSCHTHTHTARIIFLAPNLAPGDVPGLGRLGVRTACERSLRRRGVGERGGGGAPHASAELAWTQAYAPRGP